MTPVTYVDNVPGVIKELAISLTVRLSVAEQMVLVSCIVNKA